MSQIQTTIDRSFIIPPIDATDPLAAIRMRRRLKRLRRKHGIKARWAEAKQSGDRQ